MLINPTKTRLDNIIEKSKRRNDVLHVDLEKYKELHGDFIPFKFHQNCVSTYTSEQHTKRALVKAQKEANEKDILVPAKRTRRSEVPSFDWKLHCLFCGETCPVIPDPRHPDRWRDVYECHTSDRPGRPTFKDTILTVILAL